MLKVTFYERAHLDGILALCVAEGWMTFASDPDRADRALTAPGVTTAVALDEGDEEVLGFAQMLSDGNIQAYLANLLVAATRRREGIARALLDSAIGRAGGERVSLLSEEGAVGFYGALNHQQRQGFRIYPPFGPAAAPTETS